jgi:formate hydrogenlyase subunit 3/multisubunit Na+/H+ antiporter MnhD subunit
VVLILLAILIAALLVLAAVAAFIPTRIGEWGCTGIAGAIALLAIVALAVPETMTRLTPPGETPLRLALDPLGASFLLLLGLAAVVRPDGGPLGFAGAALAFVAADAFALVAGIVLAVFVARRPLPALLAALFPIGAFALMGHGGDFVAIRASPPDGWLVLLLVLSAATALLTASPLLAGFLLLRVLFDLCGPTQPLWWAVPLLLGGTATALAATLRASLADTLHAQAAAAAMHQVSLAVTALGIALLARAVDLPALASLALEAAWLALACLVFCRALLLVCAEAIETAAGTRRLDRLGGLIHRMPTTTACHLAALFAVAALPPGLGFAAFWPLFQALLVAARIDGLGLELLIAVSVAALAASVGIAALAAVRVFGVAFLGRPRSPRAAVAEEAARPVLARLAGLAGLITVLGLLPGLALLPASAWTGDSAFPHEPWPGYSALAIVALLMMAGGAAVWVRRGIASGERRREPAWSEGFAAPPPWLPFGDPATQVGPASFSEPLRQLAATVPKLPLDIWPTRLRDALLRGLATLSEWGIEVTLAVTALAIAAWLASS